MKNFKPGQKVVYKKTVLPGDIHNDICICPKEGETVTIKRKCIVYDEGWDIEEYPTGKDGYPQCLAEQSLYPIEEKEQTVTLAIKKIKLEPQKVLEQTEELLHAN